ncbi:palmitoyltransferase ZDHHC16 isoform X5 [Sagmatias obliquidens]|uniref:Palmitoyltransferase ZDHHC16 isoform X5 n=2 Tax=Delphinidae TaxID=9726 RepID=A0A2U4BQ67_TURTR|nr:palmitoyltransferase ZDHHC16 isoform X5 [Tursiops truncatus]XP_026968004.1 palmitoyltransferase ZDHHC16 isoform X5 [Lagenorhynchus obliquidens]
MLAGVSLLLFVGQIDIRPAFPLQHPSSSFIQQVFIEHFHDPGAMRGQRSLLLGPARLCLRLLLLLGYRRRCPPLLRGLVQRWRYGKVCLRSLLHNSFAGSDTAVDAAFEPIYWLVDNVIRWCGVVFVVLVIVLTSSIVAIAYLCILPLILQTYSVPRLCWHFFYSHWNLILIVFHYYQAITTPPGYPPPGRNDITTVSICKKCINPKPARTHHCSICNSYGSWDLFREAYAAIETYHQTPPPTFSFRERVTHKSLVYLWFLCSSVALALGALTVWHAVLISRGETSIERHINKKERRRLQAKGRVFRNHYNYGCLDNWKVFLGVDTGRHWLTRVLLPSSHLPHGNGMSWDPPPWVTAHSASVMAV